MVRKVTPAQLRNLVRQEEARKRQAINKYNAAARKHNAEVDRAVNQHNVEVRKTKQEVQRYNNAVQAHNARVRADRQRLNREVQRVERSRSAQFPVVRQSSLSLHQAYRHVDTAADADDWGLTGNGLVDLAETETANSALLANVLTGDRDALPVEDSLIAGDLTAFSHDLDRRWRGALFSLNPHNPDAARHFCTSAREVITQLIDISAPDHVVLNALEECQLTNSGRPVRRDKIRYLLDQSGNDHESLTSFVDSDIDDVVGLFRVFNDATHGSAGTFDLPTLFALKGRVEGAVRFLTTIAKPN